MAWHFDATVSPTQGIYVTNDPIALVYGDLSVGVWVRFGLEATGFVVIRQGPGGFNSLAVEVAYDATGGWGLRATHTVGGSYPIGVVCIPGLVDSQYKVNAGTWRYFAFARYTGSMTYVSYFGSRTALIDGPTQVYTSPPIEWPYDPYWSLDVGNYYDGTVPNARWRSHHIDIGPLVYYRRALTKGQFLAAANCSPIEEDLVFWSKMLDPVTDLSPHHWTVLKDGNPDYVAPDLCVRAGATQGYGMYGA